MHAIQILSSQPWVERLGWTLVHFLWQGVLICALYAIARAWILPSGSVNARYLLGCGALSLMMIAPLVTFGLTSPQVPAPLSGQAVSPVPGSSFNAPSGPAASTPEAAAARWPARVLPWIVAIWIAGAIALWLRLIGGWLVAAGMRSKKVRPAPPEWQEVLRRLGKQIGMSRPVRMLVSAVVHVPAVVGGIRPIVLMPVGALAGLPAEQIEALLLHELAHIRRHDYLVNIVQSIAEALLFYHPAVWWISAHIRSERELCCDDIAVAASGDVLTYARALAGLESFRPARLEAVMAAGGGSLAHRIARLLGQSRQPSRTISGPGIIASAVLTAAMACGVLMIAFPAFTAEGQTPANLQAKANVNQGVTAFESMKYEIAAAYFEQALQLDPQLTEAELYLARTNTMRMVPGKKSDENQTYAEKAIEGFNNVLRKEPNSVAAVAGLAAVYQNTGNMDDLGKAREYYLKVAELSPLEPVAFYAIGSIDWLLAYDKRTPKPPEQKTLLIDDGLRHLEIALALSPDYDDAMTYKNLLLREKAQLTADAVERQRLIAEADDWFNKALETRRKNQNAPKTSKNGPIDLAPPPPPPPRNPTIFKD